MNGGGRFPAFSLVKNNPIEAAAISKLVSPRVPQRESINTAYQTQQNQLYGISNEIQTRITDNQNITQIFPDIELAIQILVSCILSPKDMVQTQVIYRFEESILPSHVGSAVLQEIQNQLENYHKVTEELPTILRDMLFDTGSHPKLVLPESAVDEMINQPSMITMESLNAIWDKETKGLKPLGILGTPDLPNHPKTVMEQFTHNHYNPKGRAYPMETVDGTVISLEGVVEVSDNFSLFKVPTLLEAAREQRIKEMVRPSLSRGLALSQEAANNKLSDNQFRSALFKGAQAKTENFIRIPERDALKRKSIGRPLVQKIPSEAVIPVYPPGDETKPLGYFILVDDEGHPLTVKSQRQIYNQANQVISSTNNNQSGQSTMTSLLIQKARNNLAGNQKVTQLEQLSQIYSQIVEQDLLKRLRNGINGTDATISKNEDVYRMMLARSLCSMMTRLIYVPKELMTYFAFKYHDNGVGKSLMDDVKMLCSMRAILLFSKVQAEAKSSIAITEVNMSLDPRSPDPMKDIEMATDLISKTRQQYFPLGANSAPELLDWIHRAGFELHFEGHPALPQTKFQFNTKNFDRQDPNADLDEGLRKQTYMAFGLSPELLDTGFDAEFAATVTANNILLSKRTIQYQDAFSKQLTQYAKNIALSDMVILVAISDIITANEDAIAASLSEEDKARYTVNPLAWKETFVNQVVNSIVLEFPKPELTAINTQLEAFKKYDEAMEETLKYWVSNEILTTSMAGDISNYADDIVKILKAHFMRQWMAKEGFMTELADVVATDDDKKPLIDIYSVNQEHLKGLMLSALRFMKAMTPAIDATNTDITKLGPAEGGGSSYSSDSSDTGSDTGGEGGEDDFGMGGMGDFGAEGDGEEPPADDATGEEPAA